MQLSGQKTKDHKKKLSLSYFNNDDKLRQYFDISGLSKLMNCNFVSSLTLTLSSENTCSIL